MILPVTGSLSNRPILLGCNFFFLFLWPLRKKTSDLKNIMTQESPETCSSMHASTTPPSMSLYAKRSAPAFKFGHFKAETAGPNHKGERGFNSKSQMCHKNYTHYRFLNNSTLRNHLRTKHKRRLIILGEEAHEEIKDGKLKFGDSILAINLLEGLKIL